MTVFKPSILMDRTSKYASFSISISPLPIQIFSLSTYLIIFHFCCCHSICFLECSHTLHLVNPASIMFIPFSNSITLSTVNFTGLPVNLFLIVVTSILILSAMSSMNRFNKAGDTIPYIVGHRCGTPNLIRAVLSRTSLLVLINSDWRNISIHFSVYLFRYLCRLSINSARSNQSYAFLMSSRAAEPFPLPKSSITSCTTLRMFILLLNPNFVLFFTTFPWVSTVNTGSILFLVFNSIHFGRKLTGFLCSPFFFYSCVCTSSSHSEE